MPVWPASGAAMVAKVTAPLGPAEATGQASRFTQVYEAYKKAPEVTRQRLYLETLEKVFGTTDKIILDAGGPGGSGVVPYLPLNELRRPTPPAAAPTGGTR